MTDRTNTADVIPRETRSRLAIDTAYAILRRMRRLDTAVSQDFAATVERERIALEFYIALLQGPYLTFEGFCHVEEMIGWSEIWIDRAESPNDPATAG
jgi:hypothetical protein